MRRFLIFFLVLMGGGALFWWWRQRQASMENDPWTAAVTTIEPSVSLASADVPLASNTAEVAPPSKKSTPKSESAKKSAAKKAPAKKAAPKPE